MQWLTLYNKPYCSRVQLTVERLSDSHIKRNWEIYVVEVNIIKLRMKYSKQNEMTKELLYIVFTHFSLFSKIYEITCDQMQHTQL